MSCVMGDGDRCTRDAIVSLKPGYEDLCHFHQVDRTRRRVHEALNCVNDDPCVG